VKRTGQSWRLTHDSHILLGYALSADGASTCSYVGFFSAAGEISVEIRLAGTVSFACAYGSLRKTYHAAHHFGSVVVHTATADGLPSIVVENLYPAYYRRFDDSGFEGPMVVYDADSV